MTAVLRLLTLFALLLMPFGMASAPAESPIRHHSSASMDHCPDKQSNDDFEGGASECAMPCSAALAANEGPAIESLSFAHAPVEPTLDRSLAGLVPEIATPPPKLS